MAHDHSTHDHHHHGGNIGVAFFLNLFFTILEIFGGFWTNSTAIMADALHDLGDSFSLGLSWILERVSRKGRDPVFSFGYGRFSLLGALVSGVVLLVGSLFVLSEAVPRILHPEPADARGMLAFACLGIIVNGAAVLRLRSDSSLNARMVALHLLEDVLGWAGVLVVGLVLLVKKAYVLDPILSLIITAYVLYGVARNLKKTLGIFLQAVPEGIDVAALEAALGAIDGVRACHHSHVWSIDGVHHAFSTHIVVAEDAVRADIVRVKEAAKEILRKSHFRSYTIEIEYEDEVCAAE